MATYKITDDQEGAGEVQARDAREAAEVWVATSVDVSGGDCTTQVTVTDDRGRISRFLVLSTLEWRHKAEAAGS